MAGSCSARAAPRSCSARAAPAQRPRSAPQSPTQRPRSAPATPRALRMHGTLRANLSRKWLHRQPHVWRYIANHKCSATAHSCAHLCYNAFPKMH